MSDGHVVFSKQRVQGTLFAGPGSPGHAGRAWWITLTMFNVMLSAVWLPGEYIWVPTAVVSILRRVVVRWRRAAAHRCARLGSQVRRTGFFVAAAFFAALEGGLVARALAASFFALCFLAAALAEGVGAAAALDNLDSFAECVSSSFSS